MIKADEVFNAKDWESIRLLVHFKNITTRTEVTDTKKTALLEIGDKCLVLELPAKCCNTRHSVMVDIKRAGKGKQKEIPVLGVTGKVLSIEAVEDNRVRATVECVQYEEKSWNSLLTMYSSRQEEIEKFFAAVKG